MTRTPCDLEGQIDSDEELIHQNNIDQPGPSVVVQSTKKCCDKSQCLNGNPPGSDSPPPYGPSTSNL